MIRRLLTKKGRLPDLGRSLTLAAIAALLVSQFQNCAPSGSGFSAQQGQVESASTSTGGTNPGTASTPTTPPTTPPTTTPPTTGGGGTDTLQQKCQNLMGTPRISNLSATEVNYSSGLGNMSGDTTATMTVTFDKAVSNASEFQSLGCAHSVNITLTAVDGGTTTIQKALEMDGSNATGTPAAIAGRLTNMQRPNADSDTRNVTFQRTLTLRPERTNTPLRCVEASYSFSVSAQTTVYGKTINSAKSYVKVNVHDGCWMEAKLSAPDANLNRGAGLGSKVAIDGTWAVAVSPKEHASAQVLNAGSARVFQFNGSQWVQTDKLFLPDPQSNDNISSVGLSGDVLVLGSAYREGRGAVYIYRRNGSTWVFSQKILSNVNNMGAEFGLSISLQNGVLAVGIPSYSKGGDATMDMAGAVAVFRDNGGAFVTDQLISLGTAAEYRAFGTSVAVNGSLLAVGAPQAITKESLGPGAVYIYQLSAGSASLSKTINSPWTGNGHRFGDSLAFSGNRLAVGAPFYQNGDNVRAGAVSAYTNWSTSNAANLTVAQASAGMGASLAFSADRLFVGVPGATINGNALAGAVDAYRFTDLDNTGLTTKPINFRLFSTDLKPSDTYGSSLAIFGNSIIVGARNRSSPNNGAGAVYLHQLR